MRKMGQWLMVLGLLILMYKFIEKESLISAINKGLPPSEAQILQGILLGGNDLFNKKMIGELRNSGLIHLVVVSGSSVLLLSRSLIEGLAGVVGRKKAIVLGVGSIWKYAEITGWQIPVIRAAIFCSFIYWAQIMGRKINVLRAVGLMIIVMVMADVSVIRSWSFWLSLSAFIGVLSYERVVKSEGWKKEVGRNIWVSLWISPILIMMTGNFSLLAVAANLAVMTMVEIIMVVGGIGMMINMSWISYPMLKIFLMIVEFFGKYPLITINWNWLLTIGCYLILATIVVRKKYAVD